MSLAMRLRVQAGCAVSGARTIEDGDWKNYGLPSPFLHVSAITNSRHINHTHPSAFGEPGSNKYVMRHIKALKERRLILYSFI